MELGHQFKLQVINADIFSESKFTPEQSYEWLSTELKAYQKPCVVVVSENDLQSLVQMISLISQFPAQPIELAVTGPQSVMFRVNPPITIEGDIWQALGQRYGLSDSDKLDVLNWTGLRGGHIRQFSWFKLNGWNKPTEFTQKLGQHFKDIDSQHCYPLRCYDGSDW